MESSSPLGDSLSPESTVTTLLSSSGHLRSSLLPPEPNTTFIYRDKNYDSASAALDAYITDFDQSCQKCRSSAGSLVLPHSQPSTPRKPRVGTLRNRDVLRERLTDRELDFLNLPVSSLHHRLNRDRISMTTDELLSIPYDGSMPVTHTSAFIQGLLSGSGGSELFPSSIAPAHRAGAGLSSSYVDGEHFNLDPNCLNQFLNQNCLLVRTPRSSRCKGKPKMGRFHPSVGIPSSTHRAADLHLPHWLTSNKAHMDCSEISSLPDLSYPAWIQCCDFGEPELWDEPGAPPPGASRGEAPCWVSDLEKDEALKEAPAQIEGEQNLRDLRLQLAEQISALAAEGGGSHSLVALFRDNRIQALIQKADQVLDSLSSGGAGSSADKGCCFHGNTTWKQPGPVEAVKQMLFRLQAVEAELQRQRIDTDCPGTLEKQVESHGLDTTAAEPLSNLNVHI
ncbi:hypothetical protein XENOCAPTIV_018597 [Xenoophorus captivus]|uniref:Lung adenoma susceptibility protein 2 n=1 Tax=Xenoophorus captivus TaxID=1517983 RepID=A0ABV0RLK4_9TELE